MIVHQRFIQANLVSGYYFTSETQDLPRSYLIQFTYFTIDKNEAPEWSYDWPRVPELIEKKAKTTKPILPTLA